MWSRACHYRKEAITRALQVTVKEMGYSEMRSKQEEVVGHFLSGRDVFVSPPTGSGKSLCYSVLPRLFDRLRHVLTTRSIVVVVSPLVALMKEQVRSFDKKTVRAIYE